MVSGFGSTLEGRKVVLKREGGRSRDRLGFEIKRVFLKQWAARARHTSTE